MEHLAAEPCMVLIMYMEMGSTQSDKKSLNHKKMQSNEFVGTC